MSRPTLKAIFRHAKTQEWNKDKRLMTQYFKNNIYVGLVIKVYGFYIS